MTDRVREERGDREGAPHEALATGALRGASIAGTRRLAFADAALELRLVPTAGDVAPVLAPPPRIEYDAIAGVAREGAVVTLRLAHGDVIRLDLGHDEAGAAIERRIVERCCVLPELTRALRSLGARRGGTGDAERDRFFTPLLAARRAAAERVTPADVAAAYDGPALARRIESTLEEFAAARHPEHARARRALEARLVDAVEPLLGALERLGAPADADAVRAWRGWTARLRVVYERADACWPAVQALLSRPAPPPPRAGWLRTGPRAE
jgi:hypothetical protein